MTHEEQRRYVWWSKNVRYETPYAVTGGGQHTGS